MPQSLSQRIEALRAEIEEFIDAKVAEIKKECTNLPLGVIRNSITRGTGCQCNTFLELTKGEP